MTRSALAGSLVQHTSDGRGTDDSPTGGPAADRGDAPVPRGPILLVESDRALGRALAEQLAADGYRVQLARTAEHARVLAAGGAPRLALLGKLECPLGALQLLAEIRDCASPDLPWDPTLPTIVMGSRQHDLDMLRAFETGADDFLERPARYLELRARVRAVLRRSENQALRRPMIEVGSLSIDVDARAVSVHGRSVSLRRLEYELLLQLASNPGRVFAKQELLRAVWGYRCVGSTRTLDTHASRLRRKLDVDDHERWVINIRGVGYRLL